MVSLRRKRHKYIYIYICDAPRQGGGGEGPQWVRGLPFILLIKSSRLGETGDNRVRFIGNSERAPARQSSLVRDASARKTPAFISQFYYMIIKKKNKSCSVPSSKN